MLSDYSASKVAGTPVTFEVLQNGNVVETHDVTLTASGGYSFETSTSRRVELRVKGRHWLVKTASVDLTNGEKTNLTLINGDVNGDNRINVLDYAILKANYNKTNVGSHTADLNGDGNINVLDYSILKKNYNRIGE